MYTLVDHAKQVAMQAVVKLFGIFRESNCNSLFWINKPNVNLFLIFIFAPQFSTVSTLPLNTLGYLDLFHVAQG